MKSNEVSEMVRGSCLSWITFGMRILKNGRNLNPLCWYMKNSRNNTINSMRVSQKMKATLNVDFKGLSEEMPWALFKQMAFYGSEKGLDSRVNEIAMEITEMWGSFESFTLGSLMPMIVLMSGRLVFIVIFGS